MCPDGTYAARGEGPRDVLEGAYYTRQEAPGTRWLLNRPEGSESCGWVSREVRRPRGVGVCDGETETGLCAGGGSEGRPDIWVDPGGC